MKGTRCSWLRSCDWSCYRVGVSTFRRETKEYLEAEADRELIGNSSGYLFQMFDSSSNRRVARQPAPAPLSPPTTVTRSPPQPQPEPKPERRTGTGGCTTPSSVPFYVAFSSLFLTERTMPSPPLPLPLPALLFERQRLAYKSPNQNRNSSRLLLTGSCLGEFPKPRPSKGKGMCTIFLRGGIDTVTSP